LGKLLGKQQEIISSDEQTDLNKTFLEGLEAGERQSCRWKTRIKQASRVTRGEEWTVGVDKGRCRDKAFCCAIHDVDLTVAVD